MTMTMKNEFLDKLLSKVEINLDIKIVDTKIPPQGMDSRVFFVKSTEGREYAIKYHVRGISGDVIALKLLDGKKIDVPVPKIFGAFEFEDGQVVIMEKIDFPLLESVPVSDVGRYVPSMVRNLKKIHEVKSNKAGFLTSVDNSLSWKEIVLAKFTGADSQFDWREIAFRQGLDSDLVLKSVEKIIRRIEKTEFVAGSYSLLHTDFNQRNLFVDPASNEIAAIIDWEEVMFGDPIYDFARVRMYMWHFNLPKETSDQYYSLLLFSEEQKRLEELYWLLRIIEYLAYYSENLNDFNVGRIKLHQDFLGAYEWGI